MRTLTVPRPADTGGRTVPYDLVKELTFALIGVLVLVLLLGAFLSSPDVPPVTIQSWAQAQPVDFVTTAVGELAGSATSGQYGPPYNDQRGSVQRLGFISPQSLAGVHAPVDLAQSFVLAPLQQASIGDPSLKAALAQYTAASASQQQAWLTAYGKALANGKEHNGAVVVAAGSYGPLPAMFASLLEIARAGGLDGAPPRTGGFYQTDYTAPLLFIGDGGYLASLAQGQHLTGNQWGMMNETGRYPGQTWLWLYMLWYQLPPYNSSVNADLLVVLTMAILSLGLLLVPFIPVLRDIPRWIPIYRLIWRRYYAEDAKGARRP